LYATLQTPAETLHELYPLLSASYVMGHGM
jgi:hypothetical protein